MRFLWLTIIFLGLVMASSTARAVEESASTLILREDDFEIRDYAPLVVAETEVSGPRGAAINEGFRCLARYIFGANEPKREIAMTAPVSQRPAGQRIAMTSPVTQAGGENSWIVSFVMPRGSRLQDMPEPLDSAVVLRERPERRVAAVRFSGFATQSSLDRHASELLRQVDAHGETTIGAVSYAFYDPPWTLPWARRNEVVVELAIRSSER